MKYYITYARTCQQNTKVPHEAERIAVEYLVSGKHQKVLEFLRHHPANMYCLQ